MHLGLFTAAFPDATLEEVADFAAANGFQTLELAAWPQGDGAERRYAGVCHVPTESLDEAGAQAIRDLLAARGLGISSLGFYPNVFDPDPATAQAAREHLPRVFRAAALLGVDVVGTFVGRDPSKSVPEAFADVEAVWPGLIAQAREHGVKVAFENCPMIFSHDEWPGGKNLAYSPAIWRRLFEILPGADRAQVKAAIEASFKVTVQKVNILIRKGKVRRSRLGGGAIYQETTSRRAIVTLKKGDVISLA